MRVDAWSLRAPRAPLVAESRVEFPRAGEVLVRVRGCAVRASDLAIFSGRIPVPIDLPLTLGNEISGNVVAAGRGAEHWRGHDVVIPSALPCGECAACNCGRSAMCPRTVIPGRNVHGGFATHVRVPARGLCLVPFLGDKASNPGGLDLATLALLSGTVATPYQAIARSGLVEGDVAIFVGLGIHGLLGVQIAVARGAHVVALDPDPVRLERAGELGAELPLLIDDTAGKPVAEHVDDFASERGCPPWRVRIYETCEKQRCRELAFALLTAGRTLAVVGNRLGSVSPPVPDLATHDATVFGSSGCAPERYAELLQLALSGKLALKSLVEVRSLASVQHRFQDLAHRPGFRRVVLVPE